MEKNIAFKIENDFIGYLDLGFYNIPLADDYEAYKSFYSFSSAIKELFDFLESDNGKAFCVDYPKSNFKILKLYATGKKDYRGESVITEKIVFKISAKEVENLRKVSSLENGGNFQSGVYDGGGEVEFIEYKDSEIMYEPNEKKYYANDMEFDTLKEAKKFIDSGEVPYFIKDAYSKGLFAGGGSISNFDPMSLMGKTFYSLQSHGKIINVRILSNDNIKIKYEVSNTFSVEKSFTKKELFDMAKGKEVDGNSILKSKMSYGGFMDGVYAGGGDLGKIYEVQYEINGNKKTSEYLLYENDRIEKILPSNAKIISVIEKKAYGGFMDGVYAGGGDFPDVGETIKGSDIDYDIKDYFNRTNKRLLITTKDNKVHTGGSVSKFYNDLIFIAKDKFDIPVKDILKVEILK